MGGPEKEFVFGSKYYFLETLYREEKDMLELFINEYDNFDTEDKKYITTYSFFGKTNAECVEQFEKAKIFGGETIYEAEDEIEVLFG